ncbi:MAG: hypothetical protein RQM92_04570 [Candidatus Syntrophopropionicum ammoniitolerans]
MLKNAGGVLVARELKGDKSSFVPVGFIDDDPRKNNAHVLGLPVLGARKDIPEVVTRHKINMLVIAMPSIGPPPCGILSISAAPPQPNCASCPVCIKLSTARCP